MVDSPTVAVIITPRENSVDNVAFVLERAEGIRRLRQQVVSIGLAMPSVCDPDVREKLRRILSRYPRSLFGEMSPRAQGTGQIFQMAGELAFRDPDVGWVLHLPIDLDSRSQELIANLAQLVDALTQMQSPGIVVGDYSAAHPVKQSIEEHVKEQLRHYFPHNVVERLGMGRPRSEFFSMARRLFEEIVTKGLWAPYDPVPGALLFAERNGFGVDKRDLGVFHEADYNPNPESVRWQVMRTAFQIASDYVRYDGFADLQQAVKIADGLQKAYHAGQRILETVRRTK